MEVYTHKVMSPQSHRNPSAGQNDIWALVMWPGTEHTIRGKVVASPKSKPWWVLWVRVCTWLVLAPKVLKLCTNQLVVWFMQVRVSNWCLSLFLVPILELQHALLPSKCYKPENVPQLFILSLFSFWTHIWVYKGGWERKNALRKLDRNKCTSIRNRFKLGTKFNNFGENTEIIIDLIFIIIAINDVHLCHYG